MPQLRNAVGMSALKFWQLNDHLHRTGFRIKKKGLELPAVVALYRSKFRQNLDDRFIAGDYGVSKTYVM